MKYVFWCFLFFFFVTTPALALEYENGVPQGGGASIGSYEDVVSLWDDCGSLFMKGDGTCAASSISLAYTDIVDLWTTCSSGALLADGTCVVLGSAAEEDASAFDAAGAASAVAALYDTSAELQAIIGAGVYQAPLVAGTDYLAPNGDGSGLSGVVTSETDPNWPRQANCATITSGCCMDTDNGYLYCWDGDSVEEVARPGSVDTLADPNADRILFWDDGEGAHGLLAPDDSTVEISTTTLRVKDAGITAAKVTAVMKQDGMSVPIGNGTDAISTGIVETSYFRVPFKCNLTDVILTTVEVVGALTVDIWCDAPGATNGLAAVTDADSLFDTATEPAIADASSDNYIPITSFDSGEAALAEGDICVVNVDSATTITRAQVFLQFDRVD